MTIEDAAALQVFRDKRCCEICIEAAMGEGNPWCVKYVVTFRKAA